MIDDEVVHRDVSRSLVVGHGVVNAIILSFGGLEMAGDAKRGVVPLIQEEDQKDVRLPSPIETVVAALKSCPHHLAFQVPSKAYRGPSIGTKASTDGGLGPIFRGQQCQAHLAIWDGRP